MSDRDNEDEIRDTEWNWLRSGGPLDASLSPHLYVANLWDGRVTGIAAGVSLDETLGYSSSEIEAERSFWLDITHPDDAQRVRAAVGRLLEGFPLFEEYRVFRRDGQLQWIRHAATPVKNEADEVVRVVGILLPGERRGVTSEQIAQFRELIDGIQIAFIVLDLGGRVSFCNKACAPTFGYGTGDEMVGTGIKDIIPEDDWDRFQSTSLPEILNHTWSGEIRLCRRDGTVFPADVVTNVLRDEGGDPTAIYMLSVDVSRRQSARKEISHGRSLLRQFVENMPVAVAMFDTEMRYLVASRRWLMDYRLGDQDIIEKSHYEVFLGVPERWKRMHQDVLAGQTMSSDEDVFTRIDGREEWVRWELRPWYEDDGEIGGLIMYTEVITERKRAEQAVRESRELLSVILDSLVSEVAVIDRNGDIITINEAWRQVARENGDPTLERTGVGVNYLDVCHRSIEAGCEDARVALEGLMGALAGRSTDFEMEYECTVPGKDRRWFVMRASPMLGERGGAVVTHWNTTGRRLAEEALRVSEERYRTVIEGVDAVVFRMRADHHPIMLGGNAEKILGMAKDEYLNHPENWYNKVHQEDKMLLDQALQVIRESRHPGSVEFRVIRTEGDVRWLRAHVNPRYDEDGEFLYYDGVDVDVTEVVELHQHAERHATRVAALARIGRESARSLDPPTIMEVAVENAAKALRCVCGILGIDLVTKRPHMESIAIDEAILTQTSQEVIAEINGALLEITRLESVEDLMQIFPEEVASRARELAGPIVTAPLYAEGIVWGLMACVRCQGGDEFEDDDSWFLTEVAADLSNALTNAGLYRRQARIAETLQRSLIPVIEEVPHLDIATCYLPAVGEAEIGGDFFDLLDFGDGKVGVVVGDVSGKGMQAAILTAEAKYMLRAFASIDPEPTSVVRPLNKAMWNYISEFSFVTLFYGIIDTRRGTISYVNAGHELPLILCTDHQKVRELEVSGPALGIVPDWDYQSSTTTLEPDDFLMCYTDGVTDVPGDRERFGHDRLVKTVARARPKDPGRLLDYVIRAVREFGHGRQPDDQVVFIARPKA